MEWNVQALSLFDYYLHELCDIQYDIHPDIGILHVEQSKSLPLSNRYNSVNYTACLFRAKKRNANEKEQNQIAN